MIAGALNRSALEARGRQQQRRGDAGDDDDRAAQRQPQAPAVPDAPDDVDELRAMVHVGLPNPAKAEPTFT